MKASGLKTLCDAPGRACQRAVRDAEERLRPAPYVDPKLFGDVR